MNYDMEFICWINRILYPGDFAEELVELGMDKNDATFLVIPYRKKSMCIVEFYQENCLMDEETKKFVDLWLDMMYSKFTSYGKESHVS